MEMANFRKAGAAFWLNLRKACLLLLICLICGAICSTASQPSPVSIELPELGQSVQGVLKFIAYFRLWFILFTSSLTLTALWEAMK
jgi:hypothetical protein